MKITMKPLTYFFVLTWIVGLSVKNATCLKCFECESYGVHSPCRTSLNSSMIKTCPKEASFCSISMADMTYNGEAAYTKRSCLITITKNYDGKKKTKEEEEEDINEEPRVSFTICNSDLCNGANNNSPTINILLTSAILFLSFRKEIQINYLPIM
ncbi:hypothetical protein PYW07_000819 [Mythimna separata]|uniref:Protein quiver n=1 Tax=Mythimna separata TaxID=271217 RepID=A0AAD7YS93_MYTSE|nr:hypothetical protein PYW07_000819 [Mythimna separata]